MSDIFYVWLAKVRQDAGYGKARRLVREMTGKRYDVIGLTSSDGFFVFKINHKMFFDLSSLREISRSPEMTLIVGKLKPLAPPYSTMHVINDPSANKSEVPGSEDPLPFKEI
jgi:hypothetical protein